MVLDHNGNATKPDDDAEVSILLASGKEWFPFRPRPEDFEWTDIGHGASRIPRFNGQLSPTYGCSTEDSYVLGQHLCLCTDIAMTMHPNFPIKGLLAIHLHDAEEALGGLGDPVGPVKHSPALRDVLQAYFNPILDTIADKADVPRTLLHGDHVVKQFDRLAYRIENHFLRGIGLGLGTFIPERHKTHDGKLRIWTTLEAYENWMDTLAFLFGRRGKERGTNA